MGASTPFTHHLSSAHTHTLTHKCTHSQSHTCARARTHAHTHTHNHTRTLTYIITRTHSHTITRAHTHAHMRANTHTLTITHTHMHTLTCTHNYTHTITCAHSHTQSHAHTHNHTHTHTHTRDRGRWTLPVPGFTPAPPLFGNCQGCGRSKNRSSLASCFEYHLHFIHFMSKRSELSLVRTSPQSLRIVGLLLQPHPLWAAYLLAAPTPTPRCVAPAPITIHSPHKRDCLPSS